MSQHIGDAEPGPLSGFYEYTAKSRGICCNLCRQLQNLAESRNRRCLQKCAFEINARPPGLGNGPRGQQCPRFAERDLWNIDSTADQPHSGLMLSARMIGLAAVAVVVLANGQQVAQSFQYP